MVLPVFPENGLANSVIPPVLAGLSFSVFFAETLGWNFSGLIVPGYLAPILVVRPFSGVVIIVEALLTYIILRILADGFSRMGIWTRFFGQDAFFALLCISILVKCTIEGPLQPVIGSVLGQIIPGEFDFRHELHSTGLIVVPLMANIFWRHGLRRNLIPTGTNILLTFLFLKYVLIPYTNFSVNRFELMYSKMAVNFDESARFYVILLLGAALATHNKYKYGWSYHGMLIPALLGIAWLTPLKILTTFIEAILILTLGLILVKSRLMRNMTIEGPRKLLLLFTIGFLLKMGAGFILQESMPGFSAMDIYGFAYILPALLAMEMWPGRQLLKVGRTTLQTSLIAAIFGIAICTGLQAVSPGTFQIGDTESEVLPDTQAERVRKIEAELMPWLREQMTDRIGWGVQHDGLSTKSLKMYDRDFLVPLCRRLASGDLDDPLLLPSIERILRRTGFELVELTDPGTRQTYWVLTEIPPIHFRGVYVFRTGVSQPIVIQAAQPKSEAGTLPIAMHLFQNQNARALLISGTSRRKQFAEFDVTHLDSRKSLFQLVHQVLHREFVENDPLLTVQVRGAADLSGTDADILLSTGREVRAGVSGSQRLDVFRSDLLRTGISTRFFRGDSSDMHLSTRSNAQQSYVTTFNMGEFVVAWFDSDFRDAFRTVPVDRKLAQRLNWQVHDGDLAEWLFDRAEDTGPVTGDIDALIDQYRRELSEYALTGNIAHLERLTVMARDDGYIVHDMYDGPSGNRFIVLSGETINIKPIIILNYFAHSDRTIRFTPTPATAIRSDVDRFGFCHFAAATLSGDEP